MNGMIPWDQMGKKTVNIVAVMVSLVVLAAPATAVYAIYQGNSAANRAEESRLETMKANAVMTAKLDDLEDELEDMEKAMDGKDGEIAKLKKDLQELRAQLETEQDNFKQREAELIERITSLKLQDGNPNSFK